MCEVKVNNLAVNGWKFVVVTYPKWVAAVLAALLAACIQRSGKFYGFRRGYNAVITNTFTGMCTELALCLWFKKMGFNSTMAFPRLGPDDGWDVMIHADQKGLPFQVKGSLFRDGRWIELLRLGDKFRASARKCKQPNLYAWGILDPKSIEPSAEHVSVGLVALLPTGVLRQGRCGLEVRFGDIKDAVCAPEIFVSKFLMKLAGTSQTVVIPEPSSSRPASLIRSLVEDLGLVNRAAKQRFIADVLLDAELMREASNLFAGAPILQSRSLAQ